MAKTYPNSEKEEEPVEDQKQILPSKYKTIWKL